MSPLASLISPALRKSLTTPCKIASSLEWKKRTSAEKATILSVSIRPQGDGVHVAEVGSSDDDDVSTFHLSSLSELRPRDDVCGLVVEWPICPATGRLGGACGSVLRALEEQHASFSSLPICLWDPNQRSRSYDDVDSFGRCSRYGRQHPSVGVIDEERLNCWKSDSKPSPSAALDLWRDFRRVHWPETSIKTTTATEHISTPARSASYSSLKACPSWGASTGVFDKKRSLVMAKA